jgi:hypothetical protein
MEPQCVEIMESAKSDRCFVGTCDVKIRPWLSAEISSVMENVDGKMLFVV